MKTSRTRTKKFHCHNMPHGVVAFGWPSSSILLNPVKLMVREDVTPPRLHTQLIKKFHFERGFCSRLALPNCLPLSDSNKWQLPGSKAIGARAVTITHGRGETNTTICFGHSLRCWWNNVSTRWYSNCFYTSEDNRSLVSTGQGHWQRHSTQEGLSNVGLQLCSSKVIKKLYPPTVLTCTDKSGWNGESQTCIRHGKCQIKCIFH